MKNKNIFKMMAAGIAILFLFSCMPIQAQKPHDSFVVYGTITVGNTPRNGATVTIRNMGNGEEITTTSKTDDFENNGYYSVNLGNLPSGWNRTSEIRVTASYGGSSRSSTFTMPAEGTTKRIDISLPSATRDTADTRTSAEIPSTIFIPMLLLVVAVLGGALLLAFGSGTYVPPPETRKKKGKKK
jgi:hypothetical protein